MFNITNLDEVCVQETHIEIKGKNIVIPKSYHHHVIRLLTYLFALNPSTWSGNSYHLSIFHKNAQHRSLPFICEWYISCTAYPLLETSSATAYGP